MANNKLEDIGKRLSTFMEYKNIGINELGRKSKMSGAQIHNIVKGKNYGINKLLNLIKVFPDLDISWLLVGEGTMLKQQQNSNESADKVSEDAYYFQRATIEAYKSSVEVLTSTNAHLRELLEHYKTQNVRAPKQKLQKS
ncbi:MAG TPA: helix-turn-helix transcriptional regulator [Chryseosolibacter sp.]